MTISDTLHAIDQATPEELPVADYQEDALVSLAMDHPEFFVMVARFLKPQMFKRLEVQYVIAELLTLYEKWNVVPTRQILRRTIERKITEDDPFDEVFAIIDRPSNPREVPMIKDSLINWAKHQAFSLVYSDEARAAYLRGDYAHLEQLVAAASRFADVGDRCHWFFKDLQRLFAEDVVIHKTTGFPQLDAVLNNGGPSPGEVVAWLAATNVGKSALLANNAISSLRGNGVGDGDHVLFVTFELDALKTAMRCTGSATNKELDKLKLYRDEITRQADLMHRSYNTEMCICEMPPDECSVDHVYAVIDSNKSRTGWRPGVVILDYLELMTSRNPYYNRDEYQRQKHVATEVRGLAKKEQVLVFTATQTNRSGSGADDPIELDQMAESYGKGMPLDYIVSLNQSEQMRSATPPRIGMFVAKNRNGPKFVSVNCTITYETMRVREAM